MTHQSGDIIEFSHDSGFVLGVVADRVGQDKLDVVTLGGVRMRPSLEAITFSFRGTVDPLDALAVERRLSLITAQVRELREGIDLPTLWELASESGEPQTLDDLTELMDGEVSDPARYALWWALRERPTFFRARQDVWEPRPEAAVQALRQQEEQEHETRLARSRFTKLVARALTQKDRDERDTWVGVIQNDPMLSVFLEMVRASALAEEFEKANEAQALIEEVEERTGQGIAGRGRLKAFQLMCELGLWSKHENLSLIRFGVAATPTDEILDQANKAQQALPNVLDGREDFTGWFTITIDDASTQDVDDAISVRPEIDGGWQLAIHIADPSAIIAAGSELDAWARARGTSVYLPTGSIPMLPKTLAETAISLVVGERRPAVTLLATYDPELELVAWRFMRSTVQVNRRLSYDEADALLDSDSYDHVAELLGSLKYIADERMFERSEAGAVTIGLPEGKLKVRFEEGVPIVKSEVLEDSPSRALVAELMVLYNHLAAKLLDERGYPAVYRVQDYPDPEPLAIVASSTPGYPQEFARLKSMRKAEVSPYRGRHFGLGIDGYVQVSSPIRRYSDIAMQRQLVAAAQGDPACYSADELMQMVNDVERSGYDAGVVQKESQRYWLIQMMSTISDPMRAEVLDIREPRGTVLLLDYGVRVQARLRDVRPGDRIQLSVERAEPRTDLLTFRQLD